MTEPPTPYPGQPLLEWAKRMTEYVRESRVIPGSGLRMKRSSSGTSLSADPKPDDGPVVQPVPLHIVTKRPRYIAAPEVPYDPGSVVCYVEWGTFNNQIAANWDEGFLLTDTTYFFAKATLRTYSTLEVDSWSIVTGPDRDSHVTPEWGAGDARPSEAVCLLGVVFIYNGRPTVLNAGGGSLLLTEHLTDVFPAGVGNGEVEYGRSLVISRQHY